MWKMYFRSRAIVTILMCALVSPALAGDRFTKAGDALQIALPIAAVVCSIRKRDFSSVGWRLIGQEATVQAGKNALGKSRINRRPNGNYKGFPSGHTAAAFYGASYLSRKCLKSRGGKIAVFGLAALVAASRVDADTHSIGQAVAGALVGVAFDRVSVSFTNNRIRLGWRMEF